MTLRSRHHGARAADDDARRRHRHAVGSSAGNLALVAALVGTPYAWDLDGAILVLEDVSENVYRIDRMLTQLSLSGALDRVAGIAFGGFTDIPDDASERGPAPRARARANSPSGWAFRASMNFPIGHIAGPCYSSAWARSRALDADNGTLLIEP